MLAEEILRKLVKECQEIIVNQKEKMIPVLIRNIEVALEEKLKAAGIFLHVKKSLNDDYLFKKVREEVKRINFNLAIDDRKFVKKVR